MLEFRKYFKNLYESQNMNKAELSRLSKVSEATLSRLESGTQQPSPKTLKKLAQHLNCTYEELMVYVGYLEDKNKTATTENSDGEIKTCPQCLINYCHSSKNCPYCGGCHFILLTDNKDQLQAFVDLYHKGITKKDMTLILSTVRLNFEALNISPQPLLKSLSAYQKN